MEREFGLDEIRRELYNEELLARMENERKQIERRLGSPTSNDEPTPANLKIPNEEDFIDDGPDEGLSTDVQPSDAQSTEAPPSNEQAPGDPSREEQPSGTHASDKTTIERNPSSNNASTTKTSADKAP